MARILLSYPPFARKNYYSDRALERLRALGEVRIKSSEGVYDTAGLIEAARDCDVIVSDRQTRGEAELFRNLPNLIAFTRGAVDIRNIDVAAASDNGVLVTQASAGFIVSVAEWIIGVMIESFLAGGRQELGPDELVYGQSITDACLDWESTAALLDGLAASVRARRDR